MFDHLLVLDIASGAVRRVDLDGAVSTVVDGTGAAPDGLVQVEDRIYWTLMGQPSGAGPDYDFSAANGGLRSATLDGADVTSVLADGAITTGKQLVTAGGWLYWSDREGGTVSRVRPDGSERTDLVVRPRSDDGSVAIADQCVGVEVDEDAGFVYWTQKGPAKGGAGRIFRAPLALADGERADSRTDIETLWSDLPEPIDLWLDPESATLWWTDRGAEPDGNTLNCAALPAPGAPGERPQIVARGFAEAIGVAVDRDSGSAYVTALDGSIRAVPIRPGAPTERVVATVPGNIFTGITGVRL